MDFEEAGQLMKEKTEALGEIFQEKAKYLLVQDFAGHIRQCETL